MYHLLFVLLTVTPGVRAEGPDVTPCEPALLFETDRHGVYLDRWALTSGSDLQSVLLRAINEASDLTRPVLMLDTNPNPDLWGAANLIPPRPPGFEGRDYVDLDDAAKARLFADFVARTQRTIRGGVRPVLLIDHHFDSELLATASTTPMVVDLLNWLNAHPDDSGASEFRRALARAVIVRDHSDADIVLATFAATLLEQPERLAAWGPQLSRIAYYNDHGWLAAELSPAARAEVLLGYALLVAYEELIPARRPGGFEHALEQLPRTLELMREAARRFSADRDPVEAFLHSEEVTKAPADLRPLYAIMRADWTLERELTERVNEGLATGTIARREGRVLVIDLPLNGPAASGLSLLRLARASRTKLAEGAEVLVAVLREIREGVELTHVKMRVLRRGVRLDAVVNAVRAAKTGGGGRAGAAGLYASAGRAVTPAELDRDLAWLIERLNH